QTGDGSRIEAYVLPEMSHGRIPAPEARLGLGRCPESGDIAGSDAQPLLVLLHGAVVVAGNQPFVSAQRQVTVRTVWRQRDGLFRSLPGPLRELRRWRAVEVQERIGRRHASPGQSEVRIQRHSLLAEANRLAQVGGIGGSAVPDFLALQERVVGGE